MGWKKAPWVIVAIVALAGLGCLMIPRGESAPVKAAARLAGTVLPGKLAPNFRLRDQFGRSVTLEQFRGHPVALAFLQASCTQLCPLVAEKLRRAIQELGPAGRDVVILAVSADPEGDTPAAVVRFSRLHGMLYRWHYLTSTRKRLAPVWRAYYLYVAPPNAPEALKAAHTSAIYLMDRHGRERVLMTGDPDADALLQDLRILSGASTSLAAEEVPAPEVGHPAPALALTSLDGKTVRLSALRSNVILLNFWATWCTACKSEMPMLAAWDRQLNGKGLVILGVDQLEGAAQARSYVGRFHVPYQVLLDQSGDISARYDVAGLPTTLLIDRQGIVRSVQPGILKRSYLQSTVEPLVERGVRG